MQHLDLLIQSHPKLRNVDFQRLILAAQEDPAASWAQVVEASAPIVYTAALRLVGARRGAAAAAEQACFEVLEAIHADDYRVLRDFIGFGKWTSLLIRLTEQTPTMMEMRSDSSFDASIPELDERSRGLLDSEGSGLLDHVVKVVKGLHRDDRLLLAMRYEQGLTLAELDQLFRLGSPERIESLLSRLRASLQPTSAVAEAWSLSDEQAEAVVAHLIRQVLERGSMDNDEEAPEAPLLSRR